MESDLFDEILGLEEQFYEVGYKQGLADGVRAGKIEGRTFGLEKGFEKYVEMGRLHGRSIVWTNRTPQIRNASILGGDDAQLSGRPKSPVNGPTAPLSLLQLPDNARLAKHVRVLYALAESESLSTENTEEAVSDFDDRLKRAHAKLKIIERMAGEVKEDLDGSGRVISSNDGSIEDVSVLTARH